MNEDEYSAVVNLTRLRMMADLVRGVICSDTTDKATTERWSRDIWAMIAKYEKIVDV